MNEELLLRVHPGPASPLVVYLPGLHGDWTLAGGFRAALAGRATFAEFTYPRTVTWTLSDYAAAVAGALQARGVERGWVLAESFGSQIAWALLAAPELPFRAQGLVLAGGFVRYGRRGLVRWGERALRRVSADSLRRPLRAYVWFVRWWRGRHGYDAGADLAEFVARRTEADKRAAAHRLRLLAEADWRSVAARCALPVFQLAGALDPLVPWRPVRRWLARECPGFRGSRVVWTSDHNVLGCAPRAAAAQILAWIEAAGATPGAGSGDVSGGQTAFPVP